MKIHSRNVFLNEHFSEAVLCVEDGIIQSIEPGSSGEIDLELGDLFVLPGFIDIHCHGYKGYTCNKKDEEGLRRWLRELPQEGVTGILASSSTASKEALLESLSSIAKVKESGAEGTRILGIHLEGPYLSFSKIGAQDVYSVQKPEMESLLAYQEAAKGLIRLVCVAPEMDHDHAMIKGASIAGIRVSIGHTSCSYEEAMQAIEDGAVDFTHTFNAMTQLEHRAPGTVGAAMDSDAYAELIADGVHVDPCACRILAKMKGKDRLILITDSVEAKGFNPGFYEHNGSKIEVRKDGSIWTMSGHLAGSGNRLDHLVKNAIETIGIDETTVYNAVSKNPCEMLGLKNKGSIKVGYDADFTVLNAEHEVELTIISGKTVFSR